MHSIFVTHPPETLANYYSAKALAALRHSGEVRLNPKQRPLTAAELIEAARGCAVIVSDRQTPGEAALFDGMPDLVAFVRVAVDIRNVDLAAASRNGVLVTRASPGFVPAVAEWIVGAMIDAARHTTRYALEYRSSVAPAARLGRQLHGGTIGIIGYGAIGSYLARVAAGLGMRVLVHDPYKEAEPPAENATKLAVLEQSDFVVPLAVATPETENLIDGDALGRMKRGAWLINASRGNLVDEGALGRALDAKKIAGAAMDVGRAPDQMPSLHLARRADVIATPHIGGLTPEAIEHQALETTRQVAAIVRGEAPAGAVNAADAARLGRLKRGSLSTIRDQDEGGEG